MIRLGFLLYLFTAGTLVAQSINIQTWGINASPIYGNKTTKVRNNTPVTPYPGFNLSYQQMDDSTDKTDKYRKGFELGSNIFITFYSRLYLSVGLNYRNTGFKRYLNNLKYRDSIQYMGKIEVLSDNGPKDIIFNYTYHYFDLPVLLHYSLKDGENQYNDINYFITAGVSANLLFRERFNARLLGFSIEEQVAFKGKDIFYQYTPLNLNLLLGARYQGVINEDWKFSINPLFSYPLMSQSTASHGIDVRPWFITLNAGVNYKLPH